MEFQQKPIFWDYKQGTPVDLLYLVREKHIKVVYWDLGGTLVDTSELLREKIIKSINNICQRNISMAQYDRGVKEEWKRREDPAALQRIMSIKTYEQEERYWIEFYSCVLKALGIRGKYPRLVEWLAKVCSNPESFEILPFVEETLEKLNGMGIKIGIISNAFPSYQKILEYTNLIQKFDIKQIILSYEYNSAKPERNIYQQAIKKAAVKPGEILFVDDRETFVEGAAKLGLRAVLITTKVQQSVSKHEETIVVGNLISENAILTRRILKNIATFLFSHILKGVEL